MRAHTRALVTRPFTILALTLAGIAALHLLGLLVAPTEVALADLASREGARVLVAGQAERPREAPWGGSFDLADGVARVPVLTDGALPEEGTWLQVEGIVVRWRGALAVDAKGAR